VKHIRYALLLPLLHLLIVVPSLAHRVQANWRYLPKLQAAEDYEKNHPPVETSSVYYWPCYEYRMPPADRVILAAELPAAVLVGFDQECLPGAMRSILYLLLKYRIEVSSRVILIDFLFLTGVFVQWFLVGRWFDLLRQRSVKTLWRAMLVAVISGGGIIMLATVFDRDGPAEPVIIFVGMGVLLAWLGLLIMFAAVGIKKGLAVVRAYKGIE
jgi:hypothetical protein